MNFLETKHLYSPVIQGLEKHFMLPQRHLKNERNIFLKMVFLGICMTVFGLFTVQAQDFKFGAKAGINFANDTGDGEFNTGSKAKAGLHLGGVAQMGITEKFAVQGELLYSMQGFKDEVTHKLDYINIPLLVNYFIIDGLSLQAGPQFGFNVHDSYKEGDGEEGSLDAKGFDFGAALGAQYEFPAGLFVQGRYYIGVTDFIDYDTPSKNAVVSLSLGYFF